MTLSSANIQFNSHGTPTASDFDDVYFSNANGLLESQYVFLKNNGIPDRWSNWHKHHFVVAETGFGTGLNFLATWQRFIEYRKENTTDSLKTLYFVSTEKFPLALDDLTSALAYWPDLAELSEQLLSQYPLLVEGCHRLEFEQGNLVLDLWFGDIQESLPQMVNSIDGRIDAWYLDGFAPSKNPDMWSSSLFKEMARLASSSCTFATFTAAGFVKRGLQEAGFKVEKRKGFGRKRDMLAGYIESPDVERKLQSYYYRNASDETVSTPEIAVIGAGLAGANCAFSLAQRGAQVSVFCTEQDIAQGASGNPQGGFYPNLNADASINSRVQASSFIYARQRYNSVLRQGYSFAHQWCGVLQLGFNEKVIQRQSTLVEYANWPESLITSVNPEQCAQIANIVLPYSGLFIKEGGWINPPQLVSSLLKAAADFGRVNVETSKRLISLKRQNKGWQLVFQDGSTASADIVVVATGAEPLDLPSLQHFPLNLVRGQVEAIPSQIPLTQLQTVICHKGYLTPEYQGQHALGSTYVKNDISTEYRAQECQINLQNHAKAMAECDWSRSLKSNNQGRAAIRCSSPDHLPLVGAVPDLAAQKKQFKDLYKALPISSYEQAKDETNLYMLRGLGSRGLTTAPLMAEILASQIYNQPLPLASELINALNPNRFLVKSAIRRENYPPTTT